MFKILTCSRHANFLFSSQIQHQRQWEYRQENKNTQLNVAAKFNKNQQDAKSKAEI
jgi:hypothetical protein